MSEASVSTNYCSALLSHPSGLDGDSRMFSLNMVTDKISYTTKMKHIISPPAQQFTQQLAGAVQLSRLHNF